MFFFSQDIGIDLGTASVLVYVKGKGIVLREPSVVAVDKNTQSLVAIGSEAQKMIGRTPGNISAIRPLKDGVISDYDVTERMLRYFLKSVVGKTWFAKPRVVVCVPSGVTAVEKRNVIDAMMEAGAKQTYLIEEPIAAAIGAGVDITKPHGCMIVDIGGGTTDIAVIALGSSVVSNSIKVAGDKFDEAIIRYVRRKYNVIIGERTAEDIKIKIGCVVQRDTNVSISVTGRNSMTGMPQTLEISSDEMVEALSEPVAQILEAAHNLLEITPPELAADIVDRGIIMTGGGALLYGMDKLLSEATHVTCTVAEDAISCVAIGTGKALEEIHIYSDAMDISRGKYPRFFGR